MKHHLSTGFTLLLALTMLAFAAPPRYAAAAPAYLDPALPQTGSGQVEVIVTADDPAAAAQAVAQAGGTVSDELWLIDAVSASVPADRLDDLAASGMVTSVVADRVVTAPSRNQPQPIIVGGEVVAEPTDNLRVWRLTDPVNVNIGADQLHQGKRRVYGELNTRGRINGSGVTIAVVDSGVLMGSAIRAELGAETTGQLVGQADFIDATCDLIQRGRRTVTVGQQYEDYCWHTKATAKDPYGHGTAVASIIWNGYRDQVSRDNIGVAPEANILSVRVLGADGSGTYTTVIRGIQYVVQNRAFYNVRVLNLSLSAPADVPYFVDPLNKAVEEAWMNGITVVVAAGNNGNGPGSVSVPGNDPYVITVGAVDTNLTPANYTDDTIPFWSAAGPTADGFIKPDLLAPGVNVLSYLYKDAANPANSQSIARDPYYANMSGLFPMDGTSMSAAVTSGAVALVLDADDAVCLNRNGAPKADQPCLTPDQVKYRLMASAQAATIEDTDDSPLAYSVFRQGMGRLWVPGAALGTFDPALSGNPGMNLAADWSHGYATIDDLAFHYQGPVRSALDVEGNATLYYIDLLDGNVLALGAWSSVEGWLTTDVLASRRLIWITAELSDADGNVIVPSRRLIWITAWQAGTDGVAQAEFGDTVYNVDPSRRLIWITGMTPTPVSVLSWAGDTLLAGPIDPTRRLIWITSTNAWAGADPWSGGALPAEFGQVEPTRRLIWITGRMGWEGGIRLHEGDIEPSRRLIWITSHDAEPSRRLIWITTAEPIIVPAP